MPKPEPRERQGDFTAYESQYPELPKSGSTLDNEFNESDRATNDMLDWAATVIADQDGWLQPAVVRVSNLAPDTLQLIESGWTYRGEWTGPGTDYTVDDYVVDPASSNGYVCLVDHTSSTNIADDIAAGYWGLAFEQPETTGEANTTSNEGAGVGLALAKAGINLPFRSLASTDGSITFDIATDPDVVDFSGPVTPVGGAALEYRFRDDTAAADPGAGNLRLNTADQFDATAVYVSDITKHGNSADPPWSVMSTDDYVSIAEDQDGKRGLAYKLTEPPIDNGTWWQLNVTPVPVSDFSPLRDGKPVTCSIIINPTRLEGYDISLGCVYGQTPGLNGDLDFDTLVRNWELTQNAADSYVTLDDVGHLSNVVVEVWALRAAWASPLTPRRLFVATFIPGTDKATLSSIDTDLAAGPLAFSAGDKLFLRDNTTSAMAIGQHLRATIRGRVT